MGRLFDQCFWPEAVHFDALDGVEWTEAEVEEVRLLPDLRHNAAAALIAIPLALAAPTAPAIIPEPPTIEMSR